MFSINKLTFSKKHKNGFVFSTSAKEEFFKINRKSEKNVIKYLIM